MAINEQAIKNATVQQQLANASIAANPQMQGAIQGIATTWGESYGSKRKTTRIDIDEVENGRLISIGSKKYIVPTGTSLIDVIGQALVETKLEE